MSNDVLTQAPGLGEIPDVQSLDPVLRREWAEARLQDIKRNGRSELAIVGEGLELVIRVVRELEKGARPRVVSEAVTSGELRGTLLGLAGVLKEGSPAPDEGSTDALISQPWDARRKSLGKKPTELPCSLSGSRNRASFLPGLRQWHLIIKPEIPYITVHNSRLSSVVPKKNPIAHSSGLSRATASPWATTLPVSRTQEPTGRTQKVRPSTRPTYLPMIRFWKH